MEINGVEYRALKEGETVKDGDLERTSVITRKAEYEPFQDADLMAKAGIPLRVGCMASGWAYLRKV